MMKVALLCVLLLQVSEINDFCILSWSWLQHIFYVQVLLIKSINFQFDYICMDFQAFKAEMKKARAKTKEGKEQDFWNILARYGKDSKELAQALIDMVPAAPNIQKSMKEFLSNNTFKRQGSSFQHFLNNLMEVFICERCVLPKDFEAIVKGEMKRDSSSIAALIDKYGLKEGDCSFWKRNYQDLKKLCQFLSGNEANRNWNKFQQSLESREKELDQINEALFKDCCLIYSEKQLKKTAYSYRVFVKEEHLTNLFKACNNLGSASQKIISLIKQSTFPIFHQKLATILNLVCVKQAKQDYKIAIDTFHQQMINDYFLTISKVEELIKCIYDKDDRKCRTILKEYDFESKEKQIKENLLSLISHLDRQYRAYRVEQIINYSGILLHPYKTKLPEMRLKFDKQFFIQSEQFTKLVHFHYEQNQEKLQELMNNYDCLKEIASFKSVLDGIISKFDQSEKETQIRNIYAYLDSNPNQNQDSPLSISQIKRESQMLEKCQVGRPVVEADQKYKMRLHCEETQKITIPYLPKRSTQKESHSDSSIRSKDSQNSNSFERSGNPVKIKIGRPGRYEECREDQPFPDDLSMIRNNNPAHYRDDDHQISIIKNDVAILERTIDRHNSHKEYQQISNYKDKENNEEAEKIYQINQQAKEQVQPPQIENQQNEFFLCQEEAFQNRQSDKITVIVMIFSTDKPKNCLIRKINSSDLKVAIERKEQRFEDTNIIYLKFIASKNSKNHYILLEYQKMQSDQKKNSKQQLNLNCESDKCLIIIENIRSKVSQQKLLNFGILRSYEIICNWNDREKEEQSEALYEWADLLKKHYNFDILQKQLNTIMIIWRNSTNGMSVKETQLFLFLFYSIYKDKACTLLTALSVQKFSFERSKQVLSKTSKYPLQTSFHLRIHLHQCITCYVKKNYNESQLVLLIRNLLISYVPGEEIFEIILYTAKKQPYLFRCCLDTDEIRKLMTHSKHISAVQFFKIKSCYLCSYYSSKWPEQINMLSNKILQFVDELIQISKINPLPSNEASIEEVEYQQILFYEYKTREKELILSGTHLIDFYAKIKQLLLISNWKINFLTTFLPVFKRRLSHLLYEKEKIIPLMQASLSHPRGEMDDYIIKLVLKENLLGQHHQKRLMQWIASKENGIEVTQLAELLFGKLLQQQNSAFASMPGDFLLIIDKSINLKEENLKNIRTIQRLAELIICNIKFSRGTRGLQINIERFKNILGAYFEMDSQKLKISLIAKVLEILKRDYSKDQQQLAKKLKFIVSTWEEDKRQVIQCAILLICGKDMDKIQESLIKNIGINSSHLERFSQIYPHVFETAFNRIILKIHQDQFYYRQLVIFADNIHSSFFKETDRLGLKSCLQKARHFEKKIEICLQILGEYKNVLLQEYQELEVIQDQMKSLRLHQVYESYKQPRSKLIDCCQQVRFLKKYKFWAQNQIESPACLINLSQRVKQEINHSLIHFDNDDQPMSYEQFSKFFLSSNFDEIKVYCKNQQQANNLQLYHETVSIQEMQAILQYVQSVNWLCSIIGDPSRIIQKDLLLSIIKSAKLMKCRESVHQIFKKVKGIQIQLCRAMQVEIDQIELVCVSAKLRSNDRAQIILHSFKNKLMMETISQKTDLDKRSLNDLKQYINDLDNGILRLEIIRQFQKVFQYSQFIATKPSLSSLIHYIQKFKSAGEEGLIGCIINCSKFYRIILQKIDEAVNRETSFKYEIEAIFTDSNLEVNCDLTIEVVIPKQSSYCLEQRISEDLKISYKKLSTYRDKSILLIRDMEKESTNDPTIQSLIKTFQLYQKFFDLLENIKNQNSVLANFGYNPKLIECSLRVTGVSQSGQFKALSERKQYLKTISDEWVKEIQKLYTKSYLLSHFWGSQFNQFVECFVNGSYHPSLQRILSITKEQYQLQVKQELNFSQSLKEVKKSCSPLKKVEVLINAFSQIEKRYLNQLKISPENSRDSSYMELEQDKSIDTKNEKGKIILLTCSPKQIYCCFFEHKQQIKPTQVFFCDESTSISEVQLFLNMGLLCESRCHYIVRVHLLKQEVKLALCDFLQYLLKNRREDLERAKLVFVDHVINNKIYSFLARPNLFEHRKKELFSHEVQKNTHRMIRRLPTTTIFSSSRPGLGKTFTACQEAKRLGKTLKLFPVCGNITFSSLSRRLKQMQLTSEDALLIQVGHVENCRQLQTFLAQIILFRSFYFQQYIFLPINLIIFIEIQNIKMNHQADPYHILTILKNENKATHLTSFDLSKFIIQQQNHKVKFVLIYLEMLDKVVQIQQKIYRKIKLRQINHKIYKYTQHYLPEASTLPFPSNSLQLLQKYFQQWFRRRGCNPSYTQLMAFLNMLFDAFRTFSDNPFFETINIVAGEMPAALELKTVRSAFIEICIQNSLQYIKQTINSNDFSEKQGKTTLAQMIKKFPILIVPHAKQPLYEFIYLTDSSVQLPIKSLLLSQDQQYFKKLNRVLRPEVIAEIFKQTSLNSMKQLQLQQKMYNMLSTLSGNKKFKGSLKDVQDKIPEVKEYKLTLDNFFKICLIIYKTRCFLPCVIMGESGVGKTALIKFLVEIVFEERLIVKNVHAGINELILQKWVEQIEQEAQVLRAQEKRLWVFFDEFNTTDELGYIKQMVVDHRFQGRKLSKSIIFISACNPYRKRQCGVSVQTGINHPRNSNPNVELAFKVKPPPLSMIHIMWDYQQLGQSQNSCYIEKILAAIEYQNKTNLIQTIVYTHQYLKDNIQVSSVSLRDVTRFKEIYHWLMKYMLNETKQVIKKAGFNRTQRAIIISFVFCYGLRFETNKKRNNFLEICDEKMKFSKGFMKKVFEIQQKQYVLQLKNKEDKIAMNKALLENIFVSLVCLMNKIPVLIVGNPGSSKSLSIKILSSNLRGQNSQIEFCRQFEELHLIYFQGSESSTSQGVQHVFERAKANNSNKNSKHLSCILFDEIGLAEKSIHNPLKVLHSNLETNCKQISFIGISNWGLDAAKMSRFLVLASSDPDEADLRDTAAKIYECFFPNNNSYIEKFKQLGTYYWKFIERWNSIKQNRKGFFGLRDFYSYVKSVCVYLKNYSSCDLTTLDKAISKSIQVNFDGQQGSLKLFYGITGLTRSVESILLDPIALVRSNLQVQESRCLLLIVRGDALIPLINEGLCPKGSNQNVISIYGSSFSKDQQSEEYNLMMTSLIISHVSRGRILALKDINNSIQTSLYDLFNKSYSQIGCKNYCRIAVGAHSNTKCYVHNNFNAVVYVDEDKINSLDPPFLNRFEKHHLNLRIMANNEEIRMLKQLEDWLAGITNFRKDKRLKRQNFIINCSQESLVTLLIRLRQEEDKIQKAKAILLQNSTADLIIAHNNHPELAARYDISHYRKMCKDPRTCADDMVVFTYDQYANLKEENLLNFNTYTVRLSQISDQKRLRSELEEGLGRGQWAGVEVKLNYQNQFSHLNGLLFLSKAIKSELRSKRKILIIVQLHRFTLDQLFIDYINLSYLHRYEQFFIEDLHRLNQTESIFKLQSCWALYQYLQLQQQLPTYFIDSLKWFSFASKDPEIRKYAFDQSKKLLENKFFSDCLVNVLREILSEEKPDLQVIHLKAEDIMVCSNVRAALSKYIEAKSKEIIFYFLRQIINTGYLFHFQSEFVLNVPSHRVKEYIYLTFSKSFTQMQNYFCFSFRNFCNNLIKNMGRISSQIAIQPAIESNILQISEINIIPGLSSDFSLLLGNGMGSKCSIEQMAAVIPFNMNLYEQEEYLNCERFMNENFRSLHTKQLNLGNELISNLYLFDVLAYFLKQWEIQAEKICVYHNYLQKVLQEWSIKSKIILLLQDRKITILLFQLLNILVSQSSQGEKLIQEMRAIQCQRGGIILLMQNLFNVAYSTISLHQQSVNLSVIKYVACFRTLYLKVIQIMRDYEDKGLKIHSEFSTIHQLLQMLENIQQTESGVDQFANTINDRDSIYLTIFKLCEKMLLKLSYEERIKKDVILNYLSLTIFYDWLKLLKNDRKYGSEENQCVSNFVNFSNNYVLFANNANYFISLLFTGIKQNLSIESLSQYMKNDQNTLLKAQHINVNNNFTVALGNYISSSIQNVIEKEKKLKTSTPIDEHLFVTTAYLPYFEKIMTHQSQRGLSHIFELQFGKNYAQSYLQLLFSNEENELQMKIDYLLCLKTQAASHLRLYLFKNIHNFEKDYELIRTNYLQRSRCDWIKEFVDLLDSSEAQSFIPPPLLPTNSRIHQLGLKLQESLWKDMPTFKEMVQIGLSSSEQTYELLTFCMINFYRKICPEEQIRSFFNELKFIDGAQSNKNTVLFTLIACYMNHKVSQKYQIKIQSTQEDFMEQLPYLNYLNLIIAAKDDNCPLMEMFFNKGVVPKMFSRWISQRALIGTLQNPCLGRYQFIQKRHSQKYVAKSYINCSNTCDYLQPVGGNFYGVNDGCAHPTNKNKCPMCGGVIGAEKSNILINKQAKCFQPAKISELLPLIQNRTQIILFRDSQHAPYKLFGYQNGNNIKDLKNHLALYQHYSEAVCDFMQGEAQLIHFKLLQTIITFVWYTLCQMHLIDRQEMADILKLSEAEALQFLNNASQFYMEETNQSIKFETKNDAIIWHLGITKVLFPILTKYQGKVSQNGGLRNGRIRDEFVRTVGETIFPYFESEKPKIILQSRTVRTVDSRDLINQYGNAELFMKKYPHLRLYKLLKINSRPDYENMLKDYSLTIARNYPLLAFIINNPLQEEKLSLFRTVYIFISKLWKRFNQQIKREEAEKKLNKMLESQINSKEEKEQIKKEIAIFINAWNKLADMKYNLQHECHELGQLHKMEIQSPLKCFLLDKEHLNNVAGEQLAALLKVSAEQYNRILQKIQNFMTNIYSQQKHKTFSSLVLIPTQITAQSKLLRFPHSKLIDKVQPYSSFSVEYGISQPRYAFDHIQSDLVKQFYGCRPLLAESSYFNYISYIGEQNHFIATLRASNHQKTLEEAGFEQGITHWERQLDNLGEIRFRTIKNVQRSLQSIIIYFKNLQERAIKLELTLGKFIDEQNIKSVKPEFEGLKAFSLKVLADLYERVELLSLERVSTLLDPVFSAEFEENEKDEIINLISSLKNESNEYEISFKSVQTALHRLAGRTLILMKASEKHTISEHLFQVDLYWPKNTDMEKLKKSKLNDILKKFKLSKMAVILNLISLMSGSKKTSVKNEPEMKKRSYEPVKIKLKEK